MYIPSTEQAPLYIRDEEDKNIQTNSFLSPQWGGILIYNIAPPRDNETLPIRPNIDMKKVMEVFLAQVRLLLNLHVQVSRITLLSHDVTLGSAIIQLFHACLVNNQNYALRCHGQLNALLQTLL